MNQRIIPNTDACQGLIQKISITFQHGHFKKYYTVSSWKPKIKSWFLHGVWLFLALYGFMI